MCFNKRGSFLRAQTSDVECASLGHVRTEKPLLIEIAPQHSGIGQLSANAIRALQATDVLGGLDLKNDRDQWHLTRDREIHDMAPSLDLPKIGAAERIGEDEDF